VQSLRVNNVEIPNSKRIEVSLQYIFGVGQNTAQTIIRETVRVQQQQQQQGGLYVCS
jgi:ribosomal protein S13